MHSRRMAFWIKRRNRFDAKALSRRDSQRGIGPYVADLDKACPLRIPCLTDPQESLLLEAFSLSSIALII